jgi:hypothetical protein
VDYNLLRLLLTNILRRMEISVSSLKMMIMKEQMMMHLVVWRVKAENTYKRLSLSNRKIVRKLIQIENPLIRAIQMTSIA